MAWHGMAWQATAADKGHSGDSLVRYMLLHDTIDGYAAARGGLMGETDAVRLIGLPADKVTATASTTRRRENNINNNSSNNNNHTKKTTRRKQQKHSGKGIE